MTPLDALQVTSVERGCLRRKLCVATESRVFEVIYNGRGFGYEEVLVDGSVAVRRRSWFWFVLYFEFPLDQHRAAIEVGVWPWLKIRRFRFVIDDMCIYEEGRSMAEPRCKSTDRHRYQLATERYGRHRSP
jgi:hypothetical protein